jgi:hypothetical protein
MAVRNQATATRLGLSEWAYADIMRLPAHDLDAIRLTAMHHGLVRIRDYRDHISIQFTCQRHRVRPILWAVYEALASLKIWPDAPLLITNLLLDDQVTITLRNLHQKLRDDEQILREQIDIPPDVPANHPLLERWRSDLSSE